MNLIDRKRMKGALIGAAYGDAFGMPAEMWTPEKIKRVYGHVEEFLPGHPEHEISRGFAAGEVTDDTENMILVIEMLEENGGKVDPWVWVKKLQKWVQAETKSKQVIGPSTASAFQLLKEGVPIEITGKKGGTNGGAMKILPVGLVYAGKSKEELVEQVEQLCMPTHNTNCAIAGAAAVAAAVSKAAEGEENLETILRYSIDAARLGEKQGYEICSESVPRRIEMAIEIAKEPKEPEMILQRIYDSIGTGLAASESIPSALALVQLSKGEPNLCARYAANIGGDTDTIGAMACGICGAYRGEMVFDKKEVQLLEKVNHVSFEKLTNSIEKAIAQIA